MNSDKEVVRRAGTRQGITLVALGSLPAMAVAALVAALPTFFERFASAPHHELLVPMILTMPSLCVALCAAPIGMLADRWGRRPVLLLSLIAFTAFGTLPMLFDSLPAIVASRAIVGVGEAGILAVSNALMGDYFADDRRRYWLGLQVSIGPFVGSGYILLGGALATASWHGPFLVYTLGALVLLASYAWLYEPDRGARQTESQSRHADFPWPATLLVGATTVLVSIVYFVQAIQHGRIFADLGVTTPSRISVIVTIASMGTVLGGFWFKSSRPRPVTALLAIALACYGIAYVGVALAPNYVVGTGFDALGQFGSGIILPTLIAWALSKYAFEHRGRGMGIWAACFFLGQFFSPPALSLIAHGQLTFLTSVGLLGAMCLVTAVPLALAARGAVPLLAPSASVGHQGQEPGKKS
jgi:MFS family permease